MSNIININWLKENMNNEDLLILDCRFDLNHKEYGKEAYQKSHVEGAILINLEEDLTGIKSVHGGRHPLPDMKEFAKVMEKKGVGNDSIVVIYDDGDLSAASRLWWMFKYIGKEKVYVLEEGFTGWVQNNMPVTTEINVGKPNSKPLDIKLNEDIYCDVSYVRRSIKDLHSLIIDSRERDRYLGKIEPVDKKAGHIPSAVNYFWKENFNNLAIKPMEELKSRFKDLKNYQDIVVHCGSGVTGAVNVLILNEIGFTPKLYVGSWSDWISYEDNEIVKED